MPLWLAASIAIVALSASTDNSFSGKWCWDKNSSVSTFSLTITKISALYIGGHDSVAFSGSIIEDNDNAFNFKATKKKIIKAKVKTRIRGGMGLIRLKLLNNKQIEWVVLRQPNGEFYVPQKSLLHRCK